MVPYECFFYFFNFSLNVVRRFVNRIYSRCFSHQRGVLSQSIDGVARFFSTLLFIHFFPEGKWTEYVDAKINNWISASPSNLRHARCHPLISICGRFYFSLREFCFERCFSGRLHESVGYWINKLKMNPFVFICAMTSKRFFCVTQKTKKWWIVWDPRRKSFWKTFH